MEERSQTKPDPHLVAVQEAIDVLKVARNDLPNTPSREHALPHVGAVPIYAAQAIREDASNA